MLCTQGAYCQGSCRESEASSNPEAAVLAWLFLSHPVLAPVPVGSSQQQMRRLLSCSPMHVGSIQRLPSTAVTASRGEEAVPRLGDSGSCHRYSGAAHLACSRSSHVSLLCAHLGIVSERHVAHLASQQLHSMHCHGICNSADSTEVLDASQQIGQSSIFTWHIICSKQLPGTVVAVLPFIGSVAICGPIHGAHLCSRACA